MDLPLSAVLDTTKTQRNQAHDDLAYMTAYAKALEGRVAELEAAAEKAAEPAEAAADNTQNMTH